LPPTTSNTTPTGGKPEKSSDGQNRTRALSKLPEPPSFAADVFDAKLSSIIARLEGMDKALQLLQANADKTPTTSNVQGEVAALRELTQANFKALRELVDSKFEGNKVALDAALKTQKEGSDKIESNFTKQIDGVLTAVGTLTKTTDDKIGDLKDRFNTREGQTSGTKDATVDNRALLFSVIAALVGIGAIAIALFKP